MSAAIETAVVYLDDLAPLAATVGYGGLGTHGSLGYEDQRIVVGGAEYGHALSAHGPSRLVFDISGIAGAFHARVALTDDTHGQETHAHFLVRADGRLVAQTAYVRPGDPPRDVFADVGDAANLELIVLTTRFEYCHAVWLDPLLGDVQLERMRSIVDSLARAELTIPDPLPCARRCIATTTSPGFAQHLDDLLGSIVANACCSDALLAVFAVDPDAECLRVAAKYGAVVIHCMQRATVNSTVKAVLYAAAHVIDADEFVCLDSDMLVLDDLRPLFAALATNPPGAILACREGNGYWFTSLEHALTTVYGGHARDLDRLGAADCDRSFALVVNDGTFAASREALLTLDGQIRRWPGAPSWVDERRNIWWRNQFVFNLALAKLRCGVEIDPVFNVQLNTQEAWLTRADGRVAAYWRGRRAKILHFNGVGRWKYPEWRGVFAAVGDPLVGAGGGNGYEDFLRALRIWVGKHGLTALAWSFYGTVDSLSARVADPEVLPAFALLHYLVRANGCTRVIETGTARGVSAALLASAVSHRENARVVTLDTEVFPEREELWAALPEEQRLLIEPRQVDSVAGLSAADEAGERYEAALLDSVHTEEHVWAEFELARRIVCPGGLILVHDACLPVGTVGTALERIEAAGYGVVRLFTATTGVPEEDGLGLAVIENRRRARSSK